MTGSPQRKQLEFSGFQRLIMLVWLLTTLVQPLRSSTIQAADPPKAEEKKTAPKKEKAKTASPQEKLAAAFKTLDSDTNESLSLEEFLEKAKDPIRQQKRRQFYFWDHDSDNILSLKEFSDRINDKTIRPLNEFRYRDRDADKRLTEEEFLVPVSKQAKPRFTRDFHLFDFNSDGNLEYEEFLNVASIVPFPLRGKLPDPIVQLAKSKMSEIESQWDKWDKNGDKQLEQKEFTASGLSNSVPGLKKAKFANWDQNRDGVIDQNDCRRLVEIAFGIRGANGEVLRKKNGFVANWMLFKHIDRNRDGFIDHEEQIKYGFDGKAAEERFTQSDVNKDKKLSFEEWAGLPLRFIDPLPSFFAWDKDFNGRIDKNELLKGTTGWQQPMARHVFPGFDLDQDGFLSLLEFRAIPQMNMVVKWQSARQDRNNDGVLSLDEFQWDPLPDSTAYVAYTFHRLDINQDEKLDLDEYFFSTSKRDPQRDFRIRDKDGDKLLTEKEFLSLATATQKKQYSRDFQLLDFNGDGVMAYEEFLNVPGIVLLAHRGKIPDPVMEHVQKGLSDIETQWGKWDKNDDKKIDQQEFIDSDMNQTISGLEELKWEDWDRNQDGAVDQSDCRALLEIAYGIRNTDGELLRTESGFVYNWVGFKDKDRNDDGLVMLEEYLKFQPESIRPQLEKNFLTFDADKNGKITFQEWKFFPGCIIDTLAEFQRSDTNLDGKLDRDELIKGVPVWKKIPAEHTFPGFDRNQDGFLSLEEYRDSPLANPVVLWHAMRSDKNADGFLSLEETQWDPAPDCAALVAEYYKRLDRNQDRKLMPDEFTFASVRYPKQRFDTWDTNKDGFLSDVEYARPVGPKNKKIALRELRVFDFNRDNKMSYEEMLNNPTRVPPDLRGKLPSDPIRKMAEERLSEIQVQWKNWDKDADSLLNKDEFSSSGLARSIPGLVMSTWDDWDRDRDGHVSLDDCQLLLDIAFGIRRSDGELLRKESGLVLNWMLFKHIDKNQDLVVDLDELTKYGYDKDNTEIYFKAADGNRDEKVTLSEWKTGPYRWIDPVAEFLRLDADLDGQVSKDELDKKTPVWQHKTFAGYVFPGFDLNRDEFLSLEEFRATPQMNMLEKWQATRTDSNHDGRLGPGDFDLNSELELAALEAEYFRRLDVNHDGNLDLEEFPFTVNPGKAPRAIVFRVRDSDKNGQLSFEEVSGNYKPNPKAENYAAQEARLVRIEDAFRRADTDGDKTLNSTEFESEDALEAIAPHLVKPKKNMSSVTASRDGKSESSEGNSRLWIVLSMNIALLAGVLIFVFKKTDLLGPQSK